MRTSDPELDPLSAAGRRGLLSTLLAAVVTARENEQTQRHLSATLANSTALASARSSTLRALMAYAGAISDLNWPVPRSIQADIQMHRVLCESPYAHPGAPYGPR